MELIGVDSNDWAIFLVEVANVESVLSVEGVDVIIEFVPRSLVRS